MSEPDQPRQETEALRERISRLSAAILRTSVSLNVGTVLHEVVESARALTGARYGVITTIVDAAGELQDFVTSGFTADEQPAARSLPPDLPRVLADRQRIVQVLNNLFSNAARHAPESSPIRVAAERAGVHLAVSVSDEGRGVAPELLPHLFRKYAGVVGDERQRGARGSGLGLAICKGLVEAHGGRIRAESGGAGQGARFTFTLPVAEEAGGAALARPRRGSYPPRTGASRRASWWWTTTRRRCATCATRSQWRATPRW